MNIRTARNDAADAASPALGRVSLVARKSKRWCESFRRTAPHLVKFCARPRSPRSVITLVYDSSDVNSNFHVNSNSLPQRNKLAEFRPR